MASLLRFRRQVASLQATQSTEVQHLPEVSHVQYTTPLHTARSLNWTAKQTTSLLISVRDMD